MIKLKDGFKGSRAFVLPAALVSELETNPLSTALHITDIGYYPHALHHYRERTETIDQYILIYCTAGEGWYVADGVRYVVKADSYFIIRPGQPHCYGASANAPWTIYWIHFKGSLAHEFCPAQNGPVEIKPGVTSRISYRISIFEEIMQTLELGLATENLLYACSVFHHFLGTMRFLNQFRSCNDSGKSQAGGIDPVKAAIHFMRENIEKPLRLKQIADFTGYSQSQFSSVFARQTGLSPIEYLNRLKIRQACQILDVSALKISQVCSKVGITDPYYFSRLFTRIMGESPTSYRKRNKKNNKTQLPQTLEP